MKFLTFASGAVVRVKCPDKYKVRVVAVLGAITASAFDQVIIEFAIDGGNLPIVRCASGSLPDSIVQFSASIGSTSSQLQVITVMDVVTGAMTFDQNASTVDIGLPDVYFDEDVFVQTTMNLGTVGTGRVVYEEVKR